MADEYTPELIRPFEDGNRLIVPTKMLAALTTEGHSPPVSRKPGMSFSGRTVSKCSWAGIEGVEVAFYPGRVHKEVSVGSTYAKKPVRVGNQADATNALIDFSAVATNSV